MSKCLEVDLAVWDYRQCRSYMQGILETGQLLGIDPDDETWKFVKKMEQAGWSLETAEKCRNSAASMANKITGDARYLKRPHIVPKNIRRNTHKTVVSVEIVAAVEAADELFG